MTYKELKNRTAKQNIKFSEISAATTDFEGAEFLNTSYCTLLEVLKEDSFIISFECEDKTNKLSLYNGIYRVRIEDEFVYDVDDYSDKGQYRFEGFKRVEYDAVIESSSEEQEVELNKNNMKANIEELINTVLEDNKEYVNESGCATIAEYLKSSLNEESDYVFYLDENECEFGVSDEQKKDIENFIDKNYNIAIKDYIF